MERDSLEPRCERCAALCCTELTFQAGEAFPVDKPAGVPCPNLDCQNRCAVYGEREALGFRGCAGYSCHGAGQRATERYPEPRVRAVAFPLLCDLHELAWQLHMAISLLEDRDPDHVERLAETLAMVGAAAELDDLDDMARALAEIRRVAGQRLRDVGEIVGRSSTTPVRLRLQKR